MLANTGARTKPILHFRKLFKVFSARDISYVRRVRLLGSMRFPELDKDGRIEDNIVPYVVRHLTAKMSRGSKKKK